MTGDRPDDVRARLLALIAPLLGRQPIFPVDVKIRDVAGDEVKHTFYRADLAARATAPAPTRSAGENLPINGLVDGPLKLARVHRKLVEKSTADPIPTKKLLQIAGYSPNTYGREAVTFLVRAGFLVRTADGVARGPRAVA